MNSKLWKSVQACGLVSALGLVTFILVTETGRAALPEGRSVAIETQGTGVNLSWLSITNAPYAVQVRTNLVQGSWGALDTITNAGGVTVYPVTPADSPSRFFRVLFPQPIVTAGEPALTTTGTGGSYLYITGEFFYAGDQVRVGGLLASNVVFITPSLLRVELPPGLPPGRYDVELRSGHDGAVLAMLHEAITVVDLAADPNGLLNEPPEDPPASPSAKSGLLTESISCKYETVTYARMAGHGNTTPAGGGGNPAAKEAPAKKDEAKRISSLDSSAARAANDPQVCAQFTFTPYSRSAGGGEWVDSRHAVCMTTARAFSGEVQEYDADMIIPGRGLDFVWARTYRSRTTPNTSFGTRWTHSYDVHCAQNSSGGMDVYDGTGRKDTFNLQTNGVYTCPEFFREGTLTGGVFRLAFADTGYWEFNPFNGTATAGKLARIVDRNGNTVSLNYDTAGRLGEIVDDLGRTTTVAYDTAGQLTSVTDFSGRAVRYEYDGHGDLVACVSPAVTETPNNNDFPNGKTNRYTYTSGSTTESENHLLLSVVDALGQTTVQCGYDLNPESSSYLRCTSLQRGAGHPERITVLPQTASPDNQFAVERCIVNDPEGNVTEIFYDARNRPVKVQEFTGRAMPGDQVTDTENRPAGKLRTDDPEYYETRWSWNNDSLRISTKEPTKLEIPNLRFVYQSDIDPATPARKRADLRVVREIASSPVDLDGDGTLDVTERVWHYTYDPHFGSDPTPSYGKKLYVGNLPFFSEPDGGTYMAINEKGIPSSGCPGPIKHIKNNNLVRKGWDGTIKELAAAMALKASLRESPTKQSLGIRESPTLASLRESPTKQSLGIRESPTLAALRESPTRQSLGIRESPSKASAGFVTSATDPRGNLTTASYDAKGNQVQWSGQVGTSGTVDQYFAANAHGQLTAITNAPDANGYRRVDTFSYYSSGPQAGYLQSIAIDEPGVHLTKSFEYDGRGNVTRYIDPSTNDWLFTYNSLDQCVRRTTPNTSFGSLVRCSTDYAYDANENLVQTATEVRDETGTLLGSKVDLRGFDSLHRLTRGVRAVDAAHSLTNEFVYDGNNQCVQMLGGDAVSGADPHQTVAYEYDERGLLFREIAAPGSSLAATREFDYEPSCKIKRIKAELYVENVAYDGFGRPTSFTDPMGNQTVCFFDANDNLKVVRQFGELNDVAGSAGNVRLAESRYDYDGLGRCVYTHDLFFDPATQSPIGSGEALTTFAYAPNNACVSVTDTLGHTTTYGYDTAGWLSSVTSPGGTAVYACTRNAARMPAVLFQTFLSNADLAGPPQVLSVTNVYDKLSRLVSTTDSAGNTTSCAYDSLGRCVQTMDPRGTRTFYSYDLLDRCTAAIGDLNHDGHPDLVNDIAATFTWSSSSGNLLAVTDSHTNTTSYTYDSLGRCTSATRPDGTPHSFVWNSQSDLASEQDANGTTVTNTYDLKGRCISRNITPGAGAGFNDGLRRGQFCISRNITPGAGVASTTTFETFAYDGCDRLTGHHDDDCDGAFAYDSLGNCGLETLNSLATTSTYDARGNRLSLTYPGGRALAYAYDASSCCTNITEFGASLARFDYAGEGRIERITYGNGTCTRIAYDGLAGTPNATGDYGFGQVRRVRHETVAKGTVIDDRTFGFDPAQNKTSRDMTSPFTLGGAAQAQAFQYDAACRLVASLVTTNGALARLTAYGLDRMGNRTNVTGAASCSGAYTMSSTLPPADFQMNRYTATPCDARTYDDNGNLTNRVSSAGPVTYRYDYAGRLVQVAALDSGTGTFAPLANYTYDALGRRVTKTVYSGGQTSSARQYGYDGTCVIEERVYGSVAATYVGPPAGDGVCLTMRLGKQNYFAHTDDQGNALALTDAGGTVVERYDYDDYGAVTFLGADGTPLVNSDGLPATSSAVGNQYCWGGLRLDAETGLHNDDGSGYFETASGRGISGDLWCWGQNRSGMSGNNPWSPNTPPPPVAYKIKAMGANGEGKKEYVGHVSLLK